MGPRGGVVTQRSAKPCTPVQFRTWPPSTKSMTCASPLRRVTGSAGGMPALREGDQRPCQPIVVGRFRLPHVRPNQAGHGLLLGTKRKDVVHGVQQLLVVGFSHCA